MITSFGTPEYLDQLNDSTQPQAGDTENRSWGQAARDVVTDALIRPTLSVARTVTTGARAATSDMSQPPGFWEEADKALGSAQDYVKEEWRSGRAKALDNVSPFGTPGTRDFWREPVAASIHTFLPSVPYAIAAILTGGGTLAAGALTAAGGVFGGTEAIQELRDFADRTPVKKTAGAPISLEEIPVWADYMREFNGDERAAREKLFQDSLKPGTLAFNYFVNALEVPAILKGMRGAGTRGPTPRQRLVGGAQGAVIGGTQGALEGGTESLIEQQAKVQRGEQANIDYAEIEKGMATGSTFGGMTAAIHTVSPQMRDAAKTSIGQTMRATSIDTSELAALEGQINDQRSGDPTRGKPGAFTIDQAVAQMPVVGHAGSLTGTLDDIGTEAPQPGQGQGVQTPTAPSAPTFPEMGNVRPGVDAPDYGYGTGTPMTPPPPASDQSRPADEAPLNISGEPTFQFKTAKGSVYQQFDDGTTIRNKALRPEHGSDQGLKERSQATFFITPDHANQMGALFQATSRFGKRIAQASNGQWGVQYTDGPSVGKFERRTMGKVSPTPVVGMHPVELWNGGQQVHFGNLVTEVTPTGQAAPQAQPAPAPASTLKGSAEPVQGELPLPARVLAPPWQTGRRRSTTPGVTTGQQVPDTAMGARGNVGEQLIAARRRVEEQERNALMQGQPGDRPGAPTEGQLREQADRNIRPQRRTAEGKTGTEHALEASIKAYLTSTRGNQIMNWEQIHERAVAADRRRSQAGLPARNYAAQLGRQPEDTGILRAQQKEARERAQHIARQKRESEQRRKYVLPSERRRYAKEEARRAERKRGSEEYGRERHRETQIREAAQKRADEARIDLQAQELSRQIQQALDARPDAGPAYTAADRRRARTVSERLKERRTAAQFGKDRLDAKKAEDHPAKAYRPVKRPAAGPADIFEQATQRYKEWAAKFISQAVRRRLKTPRLPKVDINIYYENMLREIHAEMTAEAAKREEQGLPPQRVAPIAASQKREPGHARSLAGRLPTLEQAMKEFRDLKKQRRATGRKAQYDERIDQGRSFVVQEELPKLVKNRFGTQRMMRAFRRLFLLEQTPWVSTKARPDAKVPAATEEKAATWTDAKAQQLTILKQMHKFFNTAFPAIEDAMAKYKKEFGVTNERFSLPKRVAVTEKDAAGRIKAIPGEYRYKIGKNDAPNAYYNFAVDLMNFNEAIRRTIQRMGEIEKSKMSDADKRTATRKAFQRVGNMIPNFMADWEDFQNGSIQDTVERRDARIKAYEEQLSGDLSVEAIEEIRGALGEERVDEDEPASTPDRIASEREGDAGVERGASTAELREQVKQEVTGQEQVEEPGSDTSDVLPTIIGGGSKTAKTQNINTVERATTERIARQAEIDARAAQAAKRGVVAQTVAGIKAQIRGLNQEARLRNIAVTFPIKLTSQNLLAKARASNLYQKSFDENGYPTVRVPRPNMDDPGSWTDDQRAIIDAHAQLSQPGAPNHPLIVQATPTEALNRIKDAMAKGMKNFLPRYINDRFLDKLGGLTPEVAVYYAPYDVVSFFGRDGHAQFNPNEERIFLSHDVSPEMYSRSAIHEHVHAALTWLMRNDQKFAQAVSDLWRQARAYAESLGLNLRDEERLAREGLYGLINPHEFITETASNENFREFLDEVPKPRGMPVISGIASTMNAVYRAIRDTFRRAIGAYDANTALDAFYYDQSTVLGRADKMVARGLDQIERQGRQPAMAPGPGKGVNFGGDGPYYVKGAGAKAFVADVLGGVKAGVSDRADAARFAWNTIGKNRGILLALHTLHDMSQRGDATFKGLFAKVKEAIERQHTERTRIMREVDDPKLRRLEKFLNTLNKEDAAEAQDLMIEESSLQAFLDAPQGLNDPKNAHLHSRLTAADKKAGITQTTFADTLRNRQIKREYPKLKERFDKFVAKHPEYLGLRNELHDWARTREAEERAMRITGLLQAANLVKPGAPRTVYPTLQKFIDKGTKLSDMTASEINDLKTWLVANPAIDDAEGRRVMSELERISEIEDLQTIKGPYTPFTRRGQYALSGRLRLPPALNAITLNPGGLNRKTGEATGQPRVVFKTEAEAEKYIEQVTDNLGAKLLKAGEIYIDDRTNEPAMGDDPDDPDRQVRLQGKALDAAIKAGEPISKQYYVQFQTKVLSFHATEREATKAREEWIGHFKGEIDMMPPLDVEQFDARQNVLYVSTQLRNMISTARASDFYQNLSPNEQGAYTDMLNRAAEQYTYRRGVMQRHLPRGYVQGMSRDLLENYGEWSSVTAGHLAKEKFGHEIDQGMREMRDYVKDRPHMQGDANSMLHSRLYNELEYRLHSPKTNPRDNFTNRWLDRGLRWTMLDKLPSAGYFTVQFTEPGMVGAPLMMGKHSPTKVLGMMAGMYKVAEASTFMKEGWKDIMRALKREGEARFDWLSLFSQKLAGEPDGVRMTDLMTQARDRNMFDVTSSLEYDKAFRSSRNWVDRGADYLTGIFQAANTTIENLNRFVTLGTAYRLEFDRLMKAQGVDADAAHQQAVEYALGISHEANGVYSNYNAPPIFGSTALGRAFFQFKKYPQRIIANYIRAATGAASGDVERARQLAAMLAVQGLMAGALGLPTELFAIPLNGLYLAGFSPYNFDDVQRGFRQWAAQNFGKTGGEIVSHGILRLTQSDVASRMSQAGMLTFGNIESTKPKDVQAAMFTMLSGAFGSTMMEALQGIQKIGAATSAYGSGSWSKGHDNLLDASRHLVPFRGYVDVLDAVRKSNAEGMRTQSGMAMREPYSFGEALMRAAGITPAREAESSEARRARDTAAKRYRAERKGISDLWVQSTPSERVQLQGRIDSFNDSVPLDQRLTRGDLLKALGVRQKNERQPSSNLGLPIDRRTRQFQDLNAAYNM